MDNETRRGGDPEQETPAAEGTAAADLEKQAAEGDLPKRQTKMLILPGELDTETAEKAAIIFDKYPELFEKAGLVKAAEEYTLPDGGAVLITAPLQKKGGNMSDQNRKAAAEGTAPAGLERMTAEGGTEKKPEPVQITDDVRRAISSFLEEQQRKVAEVQRIVRGVDIDTLQAFFDELNRLEPYMTDIMKTDPRFEGVTIDALLSRYNLAAVRNIKQGDLLFDLLEAAKRAEKESKPPQAIIRGTNDIDMPIDKVNNHVWKLLADTDTSGQIAFNVARRGDEYLPVLYSINFDELKENSIKITKRLTPFDKRVYTSIAALYNAGNGIVSLTQIYKHMGNSGRPNTKNLEKISGSITKMTAARIMVSNKEESERYNRKYFSYKGSLLPLEAGEVYSIKGALTEAAIHLFREPPLVSFARKRKQITTVSLKLLQSPINKTDSNIMIDDYLIEIISLAKNKHLKSVETKYENLYTHLQAKTTMQRKRLPEKISRYLDHYKTCNYISGYEFGSDRLTINI